MVKGLSPETPGQRVCMIFLVYCIASVVLLCICVVSCPLRDIFLLLWHDIPYLCWKCR